jgi:alanine dehydrogenase
VVRIVRDQDVRGLIDLPRVVARIEEGYRSDSRGEVVLFPRRRLDVGGTTLAWLGASVLPQNLLGFRAYLYRSDGQDRGHQVVALYGHESMELRALFVGRLVGNLRTGAAIAAALHLVDPAQGEFGLLGTGYQARNALACLAAVFPRARFVAWSPDGPRRSKFRDWAREALELDVALAERPEDVVSGAATTILVTSSEYPVLTPPMLPGPRLLLSISGYRRPEIDPEIMDAASGVWTDSVEQASGPGTLFELGERRTKLHPLIEGILDGRLSDARLTRVIINTGAPWEEVVTAEALYELASEGGLGTEVALPDAPTEVGPF